MRDNEFASTGREFAPTAEEFSRPRAEFSAAGPEQQCSGREFDQTAQQTAREKKRGVSPLMLTAAAVTTAAVVLSGAGSAARYPVQAVSAEHRAFLEEVYDALLEQDCEGLTALAADPLCREICLEVVQPYARMLNQSYGLNTKYDGEERVEYYHVSYDMDRQAFVWVGDTDGEQIYIDYDRDTERAEDGSVQWDYTDVWFETYAYGSHAGADRDYDSYWFWSNFDELNQRVVSWNMSVGNDKRKMAPNGDICLIAEYGRMEAVNYAYYNNEPYLTRTVAEGTSDAVWKEDEEGEAYFHEYLENGTQTHYVQFDGGWQEVGVVEVRDGRIIMNDRMELEEVSEGYYCLMLKSDSIYVPESYAHESGVLYDTIVASGYAESEEEFLYRNSDLYIW